MRTVSAKWTPELCMQCADCRLWYPFLHEAPGGRFKCRMCLELAGENPGNAESAVRAETV
jgi:hypothetical protein